MSVSLSGKEGIKCKHKFSGGAPVVHAIGTRCGFVGAMAGHAAYIEVCNAA
jgi:hypothetical protein